MLIGLRVSTFRMLTGFCHSDGFTSCTACALTILHMLHMSLLKKIYSNVQYKTVYLYIYIYIFI